MANIKAASLHIQIENGKWCIVNSVNFEVACGYYNDHGPHVVVVDSTIKEELAEMLVLATLNREI